MTEIHSQRAHAKLSPSGAKRFMTCPGSVKLEEPFEDKSSSFANQGTAAHELAQHCVENQVPPASLKGKLIDIEKPNAIQSEGDADPNGDTIWPVDDDMVSAVTVYVEHLQWFQDNGFEVSLEQRLDLGHVVDGMFGTGDCLAYKEKTAHLFVIDYKHGMGVVVEPEENPQLSLYALGALKRYANRPVEKVTLTVVQPRAFHPRGPVRSWETTPARLMGFADEVTAAAALTEQDDAPLVPGDHCTFCRAAGMCPALREQALRSAREEFEPVEGAATSPDQLAEWLGVVGTVEIWCKKVREYAHAQAKAGNMPTGYKFVEKRGHRSWTSEPQAIAALRLLGEVPDEDIFTAPALKSVAQVEKVLGKKKFRQVVSDAFVSKPVSGRVLVLKDDPREGAVPDAGDEFDAVAVS